MTTQFDRHTQPLGVTRPQCNECVHLFAGKTACAAFPDGIPKEILLNRHDHREAYPGDKGVRFEPKNQDQ